MLGRILCFIGSLASMSFAAGAHAGDQERVATASSLFEQARALMARKEYAAACRKFEESELLDPQLGTQLHLANCYERNGKIASAWLMFRAAADQAALKKEAREQVARKRVAALEERLSVVRVSVTEPSPQGLHVECDGRTLKRTAWGEARALDPGRHVVTAAAPGRLSWSYELDVPPEKREFLAIVPVLESGPAPARVEPSAVSEPIVAVEPPIATPEKSATPNWMRITGYVVGGLGLVALGAGLLFAVDVQNKNEQLAELCVGGEDSNSCESHAELEQYDSLQSSAEGSQTAQTVFLVTGAVLLAGGITLVVLAPSSEHAPSVALQLGAGRAGLVLRGKLF